jgi:hypothetical protein
VGGKIKMLDNITIKNMNHVEIIVNSRIFLCDISPEAKFLYCVLKYHYRLHRGQRTVTDKFLEKHTGCGDAKILEGWYKELYDNHFVDGYEAEEPTEEEERSDGSF